MFKKQSVIICLSVLIVSILFLYKVREHFQNNPTPPNENREYTVTRVIKPLEPVEIILD
jgi:heme/copper-type cytochrome/quinol oxidase subunit 2